MVAETNAHTTDLAIEDSIFPPTSNPASPARNALAPPVDIIFFRWSGWTIHIVTIIHTQHKTISRDKNRFPLISIVYFFYPSKLIL